jgi:hypothetical protein
MENTPKETLINTMTEVFSIGINVCDAMHKAIRGLGSTARVTADDQDWMIETTKTPRRIITITLVE